VNLQQIKRRYEITGNSNRLNIALETATRVAPTDITVYIQGESGVGKESFSKIIHQLSARKHKPFIAVNCGAIPEGTINSELFGHEKGAFTGAIDSRKGYFESANGGTIFLDEIGELPLETQSRLLRVLENGEFIKVGSSKVLKTDVRIVTATNKDLFSEVQKGKFREDLYFRLSTLPINVPPLRERQDDIKLLFQKFMMDTCEKYKIPDKILSEDAEHILMNYRWPGNIRQLKNVTEQVALLEESQILNGTVLKKYLPDFKSNLPALVDPNEESSYSERDLFYKLLFDMKGDLNDLKKVVLELLKNNQSTDTVIHGNEKFINKMISETTNSDPVENNIIISRVENEPNFNEQFIEPEESVNVEENLSLEDKEQELIKKALLKNNGRRNKAAQELGISERTLYRKIKQYDLE
jgi:transcriptional regulator with PAS, ATPase and Fis domain